MEIALCRVCGAWQLWCVCVVVSVYGGVAVRGSCGLWKLRPEGVAAFGCSGLCHMQVALYGICGVWELQCIGIAVPWCCVVGGPQSGVAAVQGSCGAG